MQHEVWIPSLHRDLSGGVEIVSLEGETIGEVVEAMEARFPGMQKRLCEDGRIRPHIAVAVNGVISTKGLRQRLTEPSELHFIPAMSGGTSIRAQDANRGIEPSRH